MEYFVIIKIANFKKMYVYTQHKVIYFQTEDKIQLFIDRKIFESKTAVTHRSKIILHDSTNFTSSEVQSALHGLAISMSKTNVIGKHCC